VYLLVWIYLMYIKYVLLMNICVCDYLVSYMPHSMVIGCDITNRQKLNIMRETSHIWWIKYMSSTGLRIQWMDGIIEKFC
jgi:hypothetical protein